MSARGGGRSRQRGGGRGRGRGGTTIWEWEIYKPGPEVYNNLFRLHKAPPTITHTLPSECPIPNARSQILNRKQTEDGFCRNYYTVRITYLPSISNTSSGEEEAREEIEEVDISRILKYVSQRELERFENAEFEAEAEAEAAAERAEAEELAKRRLEKNARVAGAEPGSRMLSGLGLDPEVRLRGRPRGRGRGKGRGRPRRSPQNGLAAQALNRMEDDMESEEVMDTESLGALRWKDDDLQRLLANSEVEGESEDELQMKQSSPDLVRSSFVANSALPVSPIAAHRKPSLLRREVPDVDESDLEDIRSMSSAAAQLQFERDGHSRHLLDSDVESEEEERHRTKRRRTDSTSSSRRYGSTSAAPKRGLLSTPRHSKPNNLVAEMLGSKSESSSESESDNYPPRDTIHVRPPLQSSSTIEVESRRHTNGHDEDGTEEDGTEEANESDTEEYVVEAILNHSYEDGRKYYLVKWQGYEDSSDWLPAEDLAGAAELVAEYNERLKKRKGKRPV